MSIRDVATAAGVSVATVSRALNPETSGVQMRPETRERVLRTSEELGYRPNDLARALLQRRTAVIGLVVPDISNQYYAGLVRGVEDSASAAGYRVVLCNTDRDAEKLDRYLDTLLKSRADGVIVAGGAADAALDSRSLRQYRTKFVLIGRHDSDQPSVQIDNVAAADRAASHLLDLGHRAVAFLTGPASSHTVQDRVVGYRKALERNGIDFDPQLIREGRFDEDSGYDLTLALVRERPSVTAMVAANDRMAVGAMAALSDLDRSVPEQMSLVGFDDIPTARFLRPRLTTVSIPTQAIGTAATELLLSQLDDQAGSAGADSGGHVLLEAEVVTRESCAPPPG